MIEPVRIPISGKVNADGTFQIDTNAAVLQSYYSMLLVSIRHIVNGTDTVGSPRWSLLGGGQALDFSVGSAVDLGPRLFSPGETITIKGSGGQPGAQLVGVLHGTRGDNAQSLIQGAYVPTPSTLGVQPTGTTSVLADLSTQPGGTSTVTVPTPQTATAIGYVTYIIGNVFPTGLLVSGAQTLQDYLFINYASDPVSTQFVPFAATNVVDQQLVCTLIGATTAASRVVVLSSTIPLAQFIFGTVNLINSSVGINPHPPDWQLTDPGTGTLVVPSMSGRRIFLDEATFSLTSSNAGTINNPQCQIWDGPVAGGTQIWKGRLVLATNLQSSYVQTRNKVTVSSNVMTLRFDSTTAGDFYDISASGFYI